MTQRLPFSSPPRASARREDDAHRLLVESARRGRVEDLERARAFAKVDAANHFVFHGCASIGEFGVRVGFGSQRAREYAAAGRVIARCPAVVALVLGGEMCISSLAILEPVFMDPALRPIGDDGRPMSDDAILAWARTLSDRALRRAVNRRRAEVRIGERPHTRTLHLSQQGAEDLERTRTLLARRLRRKVTQSEAAERALRGYVEARDPRERTPGTRRAPPMPARADGKKHPRGIPAEVRRALMAKHGDVCAIRYCDHAIWLENAHHLAHALGGGNELPDQERICSLHHRMVDHGEMRWVPDPGDVGGGHYVTREGAIIELKVPHFASTGTASPATASPATGPPGFGTRENAETRDVEVPAAATPAAEDGRPRGADRLRERRSAFLPSRARPAACDRGGLSCAVRHPVARGSQTSDW